MQGSKNAENLRHLLPFAKSSIIDALARFDSIVFIQAPAENERMPIPTLALAFVCLSLLEAWYGISGVLTPSTEEWVREYIKQTATM